MSTVKVLSVAVIMGAFAFNAGAAPSVRVLGTNTGSNATSGNTNVLLPKASNSSATSTYSSLSRLGTGARPSSIRTIGTSNLKPVTVTKVAQPASSVTSGSANVSGNTLNRSSVNRLSVGKYLHDAGSESGAIKPIDSVKTVETSNRVSDLIDRINELQAKMDNKQEMFTVGDGLVMEETENGQPSVLSVTPDITGLIDTIDSLSAQIDTKADADDYYDKEYIDTNYYTQTEVNSIIDPKAMASGEQQKKVYDKETGKWEYITMVDNFSPDIFYVEPNGEN